MLGRPRAPVSWRRPSRFGWISRAMHRVASASTADLMHAERPGPNSDIDLMVVVSDTDQPVNRSQGSGSAQPRAAATDAAGHARGDAAQRKVNGENSDRDGDSARGPRATRSGARRPLTGPGQQADRRGRSGHRAKAAHDATRRARSAGVARGPRNRFDRALRAAHT